MPDLRPYGFKTKLAEGEAHERFLDRYFTRSGFRILPATHDEQRQGIDRWFANCPRRLLMAVEYKADSTASKTGNAFVETVSVDVDHKPGWAYTSQADRLIYYIPPDGLIYIVPFEVLRRKLPRWITMYPGRVVANQGYNTHGILVDLAEFEAAANAVLTV